MKRLAFFYLAFPMLGNAGPIEIPRLWDICPGGPDCAFDLNENYFDQGVSELRYNSKSDQLSYASRTQFSARIGGEAFWVSDGSVTLNAKIDESLKVLEAGTVEMRADLGSGNETLFRGSVRDIGFFEVREDRGFFQADYMQVLVEAHTLSPLLAQSWETNWVALFLEAQIYSWTKSPFESDFDCLPQAPPCNLIDTTGLAPFRAIAVPEPPAFTLLLIGLFGIAFVRYTKGHSLPRG